MPREGGGDAGHRRVPARPGPGAALEAAEAEFLPELLVRLSAQMVLAPAARAPLADQPSLLARQVAVVAPGGAVADADPDRREPGGQRALRAAAPSGAAPRQLGQDLFGAAGLLVRHRLPLAACRRDEPHARAAGLLVARDAHRPVQPLSSRPRRNSALAPQLASASTVPKRAPAASSLSASAGAISPLLRGTVAASGTPARAARPGRPPGAALRIARPLVGQEQPQRHGDRHSAPRQGQRDQRLAVGLLAQPPAVPPRHPHRRRAPLGQRRVVGHQRRLRPAHQPVGPSGRHPPQRAVVPGRAGDKVVRLVMPRQAGAAACHRPQALALAGTEQASQAERRPGPALPVPEHVEEGSQPGFEVARRAARGRLPRRRQQARLKGERPPPSGVPRWCQRLSWTDGRCSLRG